MEKKRIYLTGSGCFINLGSIKVGGHAEIMMPDGRFIRTSTIERYNVSGVIVIETRNTVYQI